MNNTIRNLLTEKGKLSLTRLIAVTAWMAFLIVSGYLVVVGREWVHYETFATFTAGGGALVRVYDKYLTKKYNVKDEEK